MHPLIERHRQQIHALAAHYGITDIQVFGSMARDDANNESDIDLLVSLPRAGLAWPWVACS